MDATQAVHPNIVRMLLDHGADIYVRDNENFNVLHWASYRHRHNGLKMVLDCAVDERDADGGSTTSKERYAAWINQRGTKNDASPLRDAVIQGHVNIVKMLFEYGADFETYDSREKIPLHHAVEQGDLQILHIFRDVVVTTATTDNQKITTVNVSAIDKE